MRRIPWRNLFLSTAAGLAVYVGCMAMWPKPGLKATFDPPTEESLTNSMVASPDGSLVAITAGTWGSNKIAVDTTWIFRCSDGKALANRAQGKCAFSEKGEVFALFGNGTLQVFDGRSGELVKDYGEASSDIHSACFDSQLRVFGAKKVEKTTVVLDLHAGHQVTRIPFDSGVFRYYFGKFLVIDGGARYQILDMTNGQVVGHIPHEDTWHVIAGLSTDGRITIVDGQRAVYTTELMSGTKRRMPFRASTGKEYQLRFSPDGKAAAVETTESPATPFPVWVTAIRGFLGVPFGGTGAVYGIKIFDTTDGKELAYIEGARFGSFSMDGKTVILMNEFGQVEHWEFPVPSRKPYWAWTAAAATGLTFIALRWWNRRRKTAKKVGLAPALGPNS